MEELTSDLIEVVDDEEMTLELLEKNKDFLLEPLENDEAILQVGSIYSASMSREERYETYKKSMEERIAQARSRSVRSLLKSMRDYVIQFA